MRKEKNKKRTETKKYKRMSIGAATVLLCAAGVIMGKQLLSPRIHHDKQYIFPCQGQITVWGGENEQYPNEIHFYILDEKKDSEMSDVSNIKGIWMTTETGERKEAESWTLMETGAQGNSYLERELRAVMPFTEETYTIKELTIVYPDTKETFEIGNLTVVPMTPGSYLNGSKLMMNVECEDLTKYQEASSGKNQKGDFYSADLTVMNINGKLFSDISSITIQKIEFGIPGFGIDPESICLRELTGDATEGYNYEELASDSEMEVYFRKETVSELPDQTMEITTADKTFQLLASIVKTEEYSRYMITTYISPIFYCTDNRRRTKKEFVWAECKPFYTVIRPSLTGLEEEVLALLQEKGK